ncbi:MAG: hypothetical protein LBC44_02605 [Mycoplasmataceae bacterium]|jgi:hypothetical protein|nr:hypothetical protein [Mycoplasmataceae bacterium]
MKKKNYGNIWKKESDLYRHKEEVLVHQRLIKWAKLKYSREHDNKKISAKELYDYLLDLYTKKQL